jgi:nicotinamidase-related amidase
MPWNAQEIDPDWPYDLYATRFELDAATTALLVIDMQGKDVQIAPDAPIAQQYPKMVAYFNERVDTLVVPNISKLMALFRAHDRRIVYTRNGSTTPTGDEVTPRLRRKRRGKPAYRRTSPGYDVDPRLAPAREDLVVDKLTSGAFTASWLDHALRNMEIRGLIVTGVMTDMCVLGTARAAAEIGYDTLICADACATLTERAHTEALLMHARVFGRVADTQQVIEDLTAPTR